MADDFLGSVTQHVFSTRVKNRNYPIFVGGNDRNSGCGIKYGFSLRIGDLEALKNLFGFLELFGNEVGGQFRSFTSDPYFFS